VEEFYLTASQTVLGLAILIDMRFSVREAVTLLALFLIQFALPGREVRLVLSAAYLLLAIVLIVRNRRFIPPLWRALKPPGRGASSGPALTEMAPTGPVTGGSTGRHRARLETVDPQ
jgi:cation:H+ antiporter